MGMLVRTKNQCTTFVKLLIGGLAVLKFTIVYEVGLSLLLSSDERYWRTSEGLIYFSSDQKERSKTKWVESWLICVTWSPFCKSSFDEESVHWIASTVNRNALGLFFVAHTGIDVI